MYQGACKKIKGFFRALNMVPLKPVWTRRQLHRCLPFHSRVVIQYKKVSDPSLFMVLYSFQIRGACLSSLLIMINHLFATYNMNRNEKLVGVGVPWLHPWTGRWHSDSACKYLIVLETKHSSKSDICWSSVRSGVDDCSFVPSDCSPTDTWYWQLRDHIGCPARYRFSRNKILLLIQHYEAQYFLLFHIIFVTDTFLDLSIRHWNFSSLSMLTDAVLFRPSV